MNKYPQSNADLFLYPSNLSAGLLKDQEYIDIRRSKLRLSKLNFLIAVPLGIAAIWEIGSTSTQIGCFCTFLMLTANAVRLRRNQRKTLALQRRTKVKFGKQNA